MIKRLKEITPEKHMCWKHYPSGCCPAVFQDEAGNLLVIGKKVSEHDHAELKGRVGADEQVIRIPADLIPRG